MGDLEAAHGLHFNSNVYDSTGHTSLSMFDQHHQLPLFIPKIFSTLTPFSIVVVLYLTNHRCACQGGLKIFFRNPCS